MKIFFVFSIVLLHLASAQDTLLVSSAVPQTGDAAYVQGTSPTGEQNSSYSVFGTVIDRSSREPIAKSKVSILGTKFTATTMEDGQYKIDQIPEGIYQLKAEADGYEPKIINNVSLVQNRSKEVLYFELQKIEQEPADFVAVEKQPQPVNGSTPAPVYPNLARKAGIQGTVWVKIWVDEKGNPRRADVLKSDDEIFNKPSIDAAMKWKFTPGVLQGKPVAVWVTIPFKFKLNPDVKKSEDLDVQPKPVKTVNPKYPKSARMMQLVGEFFLDVTIDEQGNVVNTSVHHLHVTDNKKITVEKLSIEEATKISDRAYAAIEAMKSEAEHAIKQWKFTPGMKGGKAVKSKVTIPIKYSLEDKKEGKTK
ncbi:MAG: TonB family protein [Bacteroidota bacterium]|jgi:TonB family protein